MRVLHLVSTLHAGGIASSLAAVLPSLHRPPDVVVEVACFERGGPFAERLAGAGVPVHFLELRRRYDPAGPAAAIGLIRTLRADVVHVHGWPAFLWAVLACRRLGVPLVVSEHNVANNRRRRWLRPADRWLYRSCDRVVAVSRAVAESLGEWLPEVGEKIRVVNNGVDPAAFEAAAATTSPELPDDRPLVLAPGGGDPKKGLDVLLEAVERLARRGADFRLLVAGEGAEPVLARRPPSTGGSGARVDHLGWRDDLAGWLGGVDLVVLPSRREGCPMVLLEAMSLGTPIVASDVGGVGELLDHGRAGWLVPPEDPAALAAALEEALASPDERAARARAARERVGRHYDAEQAAVGLAEVYREVLPPGTVPTATPAGPEVPSGPDRLRADALTTALVHRARSLDPGGVARRGPWSVLLERPEIRPVRAAVVWASRRYSRPLRESLELADEEAVAAVRELVDATVLEELLPLFDERGIEVVAVKGLVWRFTLYPGLSARRMGDLDLLVPPRQAPAAAALLQERGFRVEEDALASDRLETATKGIACFVRSEPVPVAIDLHWRLVNVRWLQDVFRLDALDLWGRARVVEVGPVSVRCLGLEDQVLHLAYHQAVKHHLVSSQGFLDLDLLMRSRAVDLGVLADRAERAGLRSALWWSLRASAERYGTPLHRRWMRRLQPGPVRRRAVRRLLGMRDHAEGPTRPVGASRAFALALLMTDGSFALARGLLAAAWPSREWIEGRAEREGVETSWPRLLHFLRLARRFVPRFGSGDSGNA